MAQADSTQQASTPVARTFANHAQARQVIAALEQAGVDPESISVVTRSPAESDALEKETGASDELEHTTRHHHPLADFVDWLGRVESVAVPGFGAVFGSGNLWHDLSAAGTATGRGSITGALVGLGVPVDQAADLESDVLAGRILVLVQGAYDQGLLEPLLRPV